MQFRTTPDEHRHVWGLWTDLDQAVVPQSSSGLTALMTEVLEEIIFHLDTSRDLHVLGAACRRLRDLVHPWHTEYRTIRCCPSSVHVWHHIAKHPILARNVRHLHITDEGIWGRCREIVPRHARPLHHLSFIRTCDTQIEQREQDLKEQISCALICMTTLATFFWSCKNATICFDDISPTLLMCSSLCEVEVNDQRIFSPLPAEVKSQAHNFELPNLARVTISCGLNSLPEVEHPFLDRIQHFLISHCPNLTILHIVHTFNWPLHLADEFFSRGRWPSLRILGLPSFEYSRGTGFTAAAGFLAAHPSIEVLEIEIEGETGEVRLELPVGTLPRLCNLTCRSIVTAAILGCPMAEGQTRPLEVLKGVEVGIWRDDALIKSLSMCSRLKDIGLREYCKLDDVRQLAEVVPSITWLNVGIGPATVSGKVSSVNAWAPVLRALPELTEFHGVRFFYDADADSMSPSDRSKINKNDNVASMLARICPKLRQVDCWDYSGRVVVLSQEGGKVNWEARFMRDLHATLACL